MSRTFKATMPQGAPDCVLQVFERRLTEQAHARRQENALRPLRNMLEESEILDREWDDQDAQDIAREIASGVRQ